MHGNKGIYELVYFVKESKAIERFKKQAQEFDKVTEGKSDEDIERLVSFSDKWLTLVAVLENTQAQCPCLWS